MSHGYELGRDIGEIKTKLESLSSAGEEERNKRGEKSSSELTDENLRVLRLLRENATELRKSVEDTLLRLDIKPQHGERFYLTAFAIIDPEDPSAAPMSPWGPAVFACCADGKYDVCFQSGCDPCAGHPPS